MSLPGGRTTTQARERRLYPALPTLAAPRVEHLGGTRYRVQSNNPKTPDTWYEVNRAIDVRICECWRSTLGQAYPHSHILRDCPHLLDADRYAAEHGEPPAAPRQDETLAPERCRCGQADVMADGLCARCCLAKLQSEEARRCRLCVSPARSDSLYCGYHSFQIDVAGAAL